MNTVFETILIILITIGTFAIVSAIIFVIEFVFVYLKDTNEKVTYILNMLEAEEESEEKE